MPSLKMGNKDVKPQPTGFSVYDGEEPKPGNYNGVIKSMRMKESKAGNLYFNFLIEFEDNESPKDVYNGYPLWHMLTPGDSEFQQIRLSQLLVAVSGKNEAQVQFNDLDAATDPGKVTKIGGKDPVGTKVKIVVEREKSDRNAEGFEVRVRDLFPRTAVVTTKVEDLDEDAEEIEPVDAEGGVDPDAVDLDEMREELEELGLVDLKKRAKELEIPADSLKGLKKPEVIELILAEYSEDEEPVDEDEAEAEAEAEEDAEDELQELDTKELKARAKANGATLKDLKGLDDEGLRDLIRSQESETEAEEEATTDDEGRWLYSYAEGLERSALIEALVEAGYDEDDFEDEEEYPQESLVDTLVEEGVVAPKDSTPF